ncbi:hypothetical protein [Streptomyces sp. NPDC001851]|uniref:hypothetical protein n=1 Tax=Streptomyces sp. NPDC001851 TaxID=3154529 RepID=UPI003326C02B
MRHRDGRQRLPLPAGIGRHRFVDDVTPSELRAATRLSREEAREGRAPAASVRAGA